jgi:hypothetical protein
MQEVVSDSSYDIKKCLNRESIFIFNFNDDDVI